MVRFLRPLDKRAPLVTQFLGRFNPKMEGIMESRYPAFQELMGRGKSFRPNSPFKKGGLAVPFAFLQELSQRSFFRNGVPLGIPSHLKKGGQGTSGEVYSECPGAFYKKLDPYSPWI